MFLTDRDRLVKMGTDCDRLSQIVTKMHLYGMACILVLGSGEQGEWE